MLVNLAKWVLPGILTVVLGAAGAPAGFEANAQKLEESFALAGQAATPDYNNGLVRLFETDLFAGVELTIAQIQPATISPYQWSATKSDTGSVVMSGFTPGTAERQALMGAAGANAFDTTGVALGQPADFVAQASAGLKLLSELKSGSVSLMGTQWSLHGAAASYETGTALQQQVAQLDLVAKGWQISIEVPAKPLPVAAPFEFSAHMENGTIELLGNVPGPALVNYLRAHIKTPINSVAEVAAGAPEGFALDAVAGLDALDLLKDGKLASIDGKWAISGTAETPEVALEVERLLADVSAPGNWTIDLEQPAPEVPVIFPYTWVASKNEKGAITFDGYVPTAQLQRFQSVRASGEVLDRTDIAIGAPDNFIADVLAALDALNLLERGRASFGGISWSLTGKAESAENRDRAVGALMSANPDWHVAIDAPPPPPSVIAPYIWSATKTAEGDFQFDGYVPAAELKRFQPIRARAHTEDHTEIGAGAPDGFVGNVLAAIDALKLLDAGVATLSEGGWVFEGKAGTDAVRLAAESALSGSSAHWAVNISSPPPPPPPLAVADPYRWKAAKNASGEFVLAGNVPTPQLQRFLRVRARIVSSDTSILAAGAPAEFISNSLAALDALAILQTGTAGFDGKSWFLTGTPQVSADAVRAASALESGATPQEKWLVGLAAPLTPDVVEETAAEPVAEVAEPAAVEPVVQEEPAAAPRNAGAPDYTFTATRESGGIVALSGDVPADQARRYFGVVAGKVPIDGLDIKKDVPDGFIDGAIAGLRALVSLSDGSLEFDEGKWVFRGTDMDANAREKASRELAGVADLDFWSVEITAPAPLLVCKTHIAALASRNAILFRPGSDRITPASTTAIDELTGYLAECPETMVHVEGHTDADGDDQSNLILSVARAEAVLDELVARGVSENRLFAVGFGESLPIAPNTTNEGKRQNRRIQFTVLEEHR